MTEVPALRIRRCNDGELDTGGHYVLYWMTANRRTRWNFALERAVHWARKLSKPLLILEALRCDYRWANDRLHQFILEGMRDNADSLAGSPVFYYPYLEPERGHGNGLYAALARHACAVVTDDFPCFFLPPMVRIAARQTPVLMEAVDANGLLPMRAADRVFLRAVDFRRFLQKNLPPHLRELPKPNPLARVKLPPLEELPPQVLRQWPAVRPDVLAGETPALERLPIDHGVAPAAMRGGSRAAMQAARRFVEKRLTDYEEDRNQPDREGASGLSPYLHFGHVAAHEVFDMVVRREPWDPDCLDQKARGARSGWWKLSPAVEAFLDQLITWRELGYNMCSMRPHDYYRYSSLPDWAKATLSDHAGDKREFVYDLDQFEAAQTHDSLWNAAQNQLVTEGRMHNYLRMLWGKKILEWSASPQEALRMMIHLNNKYAVDGRNPNSYSGIFWVLGRYDRAWGPERPIFGKIRYMSSDNTARKLRVKKYLERYDPNSNRLF